MTLPQKGNSEYAHRETVHITNDPNSIQLTGNLQSLNPLHSRADNCSNEKFPAQPIELAFQGLVGRITFPNVFKANPTSNLWLR